MALAALPDIQQCFVHHPTARGDELESLLYEARRSIQADIKEAVEAGGSDPNPNPNPNPNPLSDPNPNPNPDPDPGPAPHQAGGSEALGETYIAAMSSRTIVYKGMTQSAVLGPFYEDLQATPSP